MIIFRQYIGKKELITGLVSGTILLLLGWGLKQYTPFKIVTWLISFLTIVAKSVIVFLKILLPLWVSIVVLIFLLLAKHVRAFAVRKIWNQNNFLKYRQDIFNDVKYKWKYKRTKKQYEITNIKAYCVECCCRLNSNGCPNCKKAYLNMIIGMRVEDDIRALICLKIEKTFKVDEYEKLK